MFGKKEKFVKVCPACMSTNINSHLGFTGEGYKCMACAFDNFYPIEIKEEDLGKLKKSK